MKKIDNFINLYPVTKTLKFKLIPVGKTLDNFKKANLLELDKERAENYTKAKEIIDKYYNSFINNCLNNFIFSTNPNNLMQYYEVYNKNYDNKKEKEELINKIQKALRDEIVSAFVDSEKKRSIFDNLFKGELLDEILNDNQISDDDKKVIAQFDKFTTYFQGFFTNRKNIFSSDKKVGSISYRLINENLKTFVDNIRIYLKIRDALEADIKNLQEEYKDVLHEYDINNLFDIDYYNLCLIGDDINKYNKIISGYAVDEKTKIKGLNEYISLYNQKNKDKSKLPKFKQLYKQILSMDQTKTFRFDIIDDDKTVYAIIDDFIEVLDDKQINVLETVKVAFEGLLSNKYDVNNIFLSSKRFKDLSMKSYNDYNVLNYCIGIEYDKIHKIGKNKDKYDKEKDKYIKSIGYLSIYEIISMLENNGYDKNEMLKVVIREYQDIMQCLSDAKDKYQTINKDLNIREEESIVERIKKLLDSLINLYRFKESFCNYSDSEEIDLSFYGELSSVDFLDDIINIYNKVRNYLTKKPYKIDKIKLNFNCSTLLDGWDVNKEVNNLCVLLFKDNKYYLGIMNKKDNKVFIDADISDSSDSYKKMNYKLLPGPNKMLPKVFLSKKGIETFNPDKRILDNYNKGTHKKGPNYKREDMIDLIEYFKDAIKNHTDYSNFGFRFSDSTTYNDLSEFYKEVSDQGYKITYSNISNDYIEKLVDEGKLFLFQIYNKDFSDYSKGKKNLHTLYFEELFDKHNLDNVVYKLNGEAELFLREKSIEYKVTHPREKPVCNKNECNNKKESIFKYDLIKDKRYTSDQFEFHVPITINYKAKDGIHNDRVNEQIKMCDDNYVIGIDRGERNLIYINVLSEKNGLVEQLSLNDIVNEYNGNTYKTDYHELLDKKEKERDNARKSWKTISNIKELKEGYVSQVVHKICELIEKYDAIIVMEDLNSGFKNGRKKVEKQVYQKFEKMLIDKLNLYINKKTNPNNNGGVLKGYQLTRPYEGNSNMKFQNGFIFYVAPWNTSKIDPTTGFVYLFRLGNYPTKETKQAFINQFESIHYNTAENVFEFKFDYRNFEYGSTDYKNEWTVTTKGKRIQTFRNIEKNNNYDYKEVDLTEELKTLFDEYNIDYHNSDIKTCFGDKNKEFYDKLFVILRLILQMRNSKPKQNENDEVIDYMVSPVKNQTGNYYNSNDMHKEDKLPMDADSNGAYNIARKGLMIVDRIKNGQQEKLTVIHNNEWLEYAQTHLTV